VKKRIYAAVEAWENWVFNLDEPAFIGILKLLFSIIAPLVLVAVVMSIIDPDCHVVLNTTKTWSCVASHEEWERVHHGKTSRWEWVTECDRYERKPGHEHDWSH
jgi:hypothetical protein